MTWHYQVTKLLHRKEYDRVHPCMYYAKGECDMVKVGDAGDYQSYGTLNDLVISGWEHFSHGICPKHKEEVLKMIEVYNNDRTRTTPRR